MLTTSEEMRLRHKRRLESEIPEIILKLEYLRKLKSLNYEPSAENELKKAIRALLKVAGIPSLKVLQNNVQKMEGSN